MGRPPPYSGSLYLLQQQTVGSVRCCRLHNLNSWQAIKQNTWLIEQHGVKQAVTTLIETATSGGVINKSKKPAILFLLRARARHSTALYRTAGRPACYQWHCGSCWRGWLWFQVGTGPLSHLSQQRPGQGDKAGTVSVPQQHC